MPRYRTQMGSLSVIGKDEAAMWSGRFNVYAASPNGKAKVKGKKRSVTLGLCSQMTRTQAQSRLIEVIQDTSLKNSRLAVLALPSLPVEIPHYSRGAVGELRVAADLMERGYEVFRNMNPTGSTDLVMMQPGCHPMRVEVKFMTAGNGSPLRYLYGSRNFDILAIVSGGGSIRYLDANGQPVLNVEQLSEDGRSSRMAEQQEEGLTY